MSTEHSFDLRLVVTRRAGHVLFDDALAEELRVATLLRERLDAALLDELSTDAATYEIRRADVVPADGRQVDPDRFVHWADGTGT